MIDTFMDNAPNISLLLFFGMFLIILVWSLWPSNKDRLQSYGDIPLED